MFKATKLSVCLTLALTTLVPAHAAKPGSLPDAMEKAILRNPEVLARLHDYQAADAERDIARGGYFPRVDLQGYTGRERRDTPTTVPTSYNRPGYQLQLRQLVFDGFATRNDVKRLGFARATRYFELLSTTDDTAYEAARAYLDVLRYRELSGLAQENWAIHKETVDQIERRVKAGVGRRVDLEQAFGRLALAQSNWLTEGSNLHDVSQRYQRVVGEAPADVLENPPRCSATSCPASRISCVRPSPTTRVSARRSPTSALPAPTSTCSAPTTRPPSKCAPAPAWTRISWGSPARPTPMPSRF